MVKYPTYTSVMCKFEVSSHAIFESKWDPNYNLPPDPMRPQPVTQEVTPLKKVLFEAARHTGMMKSLKKTGEESFKREMSLSFVALL